MQSAEKKYFRQVVARQEGAEPQYMQLFNLMVESISFNNGDEPVFKLDEEALIARMQRRKVSEAQFHVVRNRLAQMLLKAMRLMQEEHNQEDAIRVQLKNAKVLERRGLFDWALEMTNEALSTATEFQYHALAADALRNLLYLRSHRDSRDYIDKIQADVQELELSTRRFWNEIHLFSLWHRAFALYRTKKNASFAELQTELENLSKELDSAIPGSDGELLAQTYLLQSRAALADLREGNGGARPWFGEIVNLWEQPAYGHMKTEHLRMYIIQLANYLVSCLSVQDFDAYERYVQVLESIHPTNSDQEAEVFQNKYFLQQLFFLNKGTPDLGVKLIPAIEKGLKKYAFKINKSRLFAIRYNIIVTYFFSNNYEQALQNCETLQRYGKSNQRRDVQLFTNILRHIAHLELNEFDALERFVKSVRGTLGPEPPLPDFERTVLSQLLELARIYLKYAPESRERREALEPALQTFLLALNNYKSMKPNPLPLGFEELVLWLKSKLSGKSFSELMQE